MTKLDLQKKDLLREKFQHELNEETKSILVNAFCQSCKQSLFFGYSVFLENFGIFTSAFEKKNINLLINDKNVSKSIKLQNINFQKCSELTSYIREKYGKIIEEKELSEIVFAKLDISLQIEWQIEKTRAYVNGLILAVKQAVISQGMSKLIGKLGDFYSLHNRQGDNMEDWYAGANVIFNSNCNREISCEDCKVYERPVLQNSWELMNCLFGKPIHMFSINICSELKSLGFDLDKSYFSDKIEQENIQIAVYANKNSNQQQLIYCTDGLRKLGLADSTEGNELVFQVAYDADFRDSSKNSQYKLDDILLPAWPKSVLIMGWIMLQNSKSKNIIPGNSFSFNTKLCHEIEHSRLTGILATPFAPCKTKILSSEGTFTFINLLGITDDEYRLSENYNPEILSTLLKSKRMDQISKLCRPNLLSKTAFLDLRNHSVKNNDLQGHNITSVSEMNV